MDTLRTILEHPIGNTVCMLMLFSLVSYIGVKVSLLVVNNLSKRVEPNALHWNLMRYAIRLVWALIFVLGIVETVPYLKNVGTALVACSSVVVAAVGLASQDILKDAIDGIFISIFKPFAVGDRVRLVNRDITGVIQDINFRFTSVKTAENNLLMIPNSVMNDEIIENSNIIDSSIKAFIDVEVAYDSDITKVKDVLREITLAHPLFVDSRSEEAKQEGAEDVVIRLRQFNSSGVELRVTVCSANINDSFIICSDIREEILNRFKIEGIEIPYQKVEVLKG